MRGVGHFTSCVAERAQRGELPQRFGSLKRLDCRFLLKLPELAACKTLESASNEFDVALLSISVGRRAKYTIFALVQFAASISSGFSSYRNAPCSNQGVTGAYTRAKRSRAQK